MCVDWLFQRTAWAVVSAVAWKGLGQRAGGPVRRYLQQSRWEATVLWPGCTVEDGRGTLGET